jgi:hypothetical protein
VRVSGLGEGEVVVSDFGRELTGAPPEMRDWEQVILGKAQAGQKHRVLRSQDQGTIRD